MKLWVDISDYRCPAEPNLRCSEVPPYRCATHRHCDPLKGAHIINVATGKTLSGEEVS